MKNLFGLFSKPATTPAPVQEHTVTAAKATTTVSDPQVAPVVLAKPVTAPVTGIRRMMNETTELAEGSALRGFLPVFLREFHGGEGELEVTATRGTEVVHFVSPSLSELSRLQVAGFVITTELQAHDVISAVAFRIDADRWETLDFPEYPSMVIDVDGEVLAIYRFNEAVDRALTPKAFKAALLLRDEIATALGTEASGSRIPLPGCFLKNSKRAVRVLRYGTGYDVSALMTAFGCYDSIKAALSPVAPAPVASAPLAVQAEDVLTDILTSIAAVTPFSSFKSHALSRTVARKLDEAGVVDGIRLSLAPEFFARLSAFEPEWITAEGLELSMVEAIFSDPEVVLAVPAVKKSRAKTVTK